MTELEQLLAILTLEQVDRNLFTGTSPERPRRVFGGQVLAQALRAAQRTVAPGLLAHSMHAYFLRPGDPKRQILFEVEATRDGRSFSTRRVVARQNAVPIFSTTVSFQYPEEGLAHQSSMPQVAEPESLESEVEFWEKMQKEHAGRFPAPMAKAIDCRPVERRDYLNPHPGEPVQHSWLRIDGTLADDAALHQALLAFLSDFVLLGAALLPHPYTAYEPRMQVASLDHALWFHRPCRVDDYLLYAMDSPTASGGRGLSRGQFFDRSGVLLASTAQESLLRLRPATG